MEGLLAAHRLQPDGTYLKKAEKMATMALQGQKEDGSWNVEYDHTAKEVGVSEKGTALWSYLLYQLYEANHQMVFLTAARKALSWCIAQQKFSEQEGYGGIAGISIASGVTYRAFYPLSCSYTAGFFGLALLSEQRISETELN
jgi:uncharacterized protein YyaL (SSP411 family)